MRPGRRVLYLAFLFVAVYGLLEITYSTLYSRGIVDPPAGFSATEDSGRTVRFDAVLGYRLTTTPSRFVRVSFGEIEFVGTLRGNAGGFPDRDDFGPRRTGEGSRRIAVFGDSFTAEQHLAINWPDRVEDLAKENGTALKLLNFSLDGGGLANWWSVVTKIVDAENYELDAVVFAVFDDPRFGDLQRGFRIADHRGLRVRSGKLESWDPDTWPKTIDEAGAYLAPGPGYVLSVEDFERVLSGDFRPDLPRAWRARVARRVLGLREPQRPQRPMPRQDFGEGQIRMVDDIADYLTRRNLEAIVVRIPSREGAVAGAPVSRIVVDFADRLKAGLIDGNAMLEGLDETEIRALYFPHDGHWAEGGSERFAEFMFAELAAGAP